MRAHPMVLAYVLALIPATAMALSQPVFSRVDEAQNFDFIVQLSHGVYPVADRTLIDSHTLAVLEQVGGYRFDSPGSYPAPDLTDMGLPPPGMSARADAVWMWRHMWQLSYESAQTPLFYVLMVPVYGLANALGGPFAAIYLIRLLCALMVALSAPLSIAIARHLAPARLEVGWIAAVFAALLPGLDLNATRISNDAPAIAIGGVLTLVAVASARRAWSRSAIVGIGLLAGLALMTKLTLVGLMPALALSALWPAPRLTWQSRAGRLAAVAAIAALCLVPWLLLNLRSYGALVMPPDRVLRVSFGVPTGFDIRFIPIDLTFFLLSFWGGEPIGMLPFSSGIIALGILTAVVAAIGLLKVVPRLHAPAAIVATAMGCMSVGVLLLPITVHYEYAGPGRYIYPAIAGIAALWALGLVSALPRSLGNGGLAGMYGILASVILATAVVSPSAPPGPIGSGSPPSNSVTMPVDADGAFRGVTVRADQLALDAAGKATWIHLGVVNSGQSEVEWTVTPKVTTGVLLFSGDYARSTQLPGDLEPGQSVTGWVEVPLDPHSIHAGQVLHVLFTDIAVDDYHSVGDIGLVLIVPPATGA